MLETAFQIGWWTILFWICIGIAIGGLLAWLLGSSASSTTRSIGLADFEGRTATIRTEITRNADQLEAIEGIGPQIAELLHKNGIQSFGQLASMSPAEISKLLSTGGSAFAIAQPFTWPFQAKLLENGWVAEFLAVGQKLTAGRLPLTGITGMGEATAKRLAEVDTGSVEALAAAEPAALAARISEKGDNIAESRLSTFIAQARSVIDGDMASLAAFFGLPAAVLGPRPAQTYKLTREASGPVVNAQGLLGAVPATTASSSAGSLLPLWLGIGGAGLLALLCALKIWCPGQMDISAPASPPVEEATPISTSAIPEGEGLVSDMRDGKPMLIVFFATAKSDVSNELSTESAGLKAYLDENPESRLAVSGYVDPSGNPEFNAKLARERAEKVAAALVAAGIAAERIDLEKPADIVADEVTDANERKVEVLIKDAG